jgi:peptide/nickel transport system permease protein
VKKAPNLNLIFGCAFTGFTALVIIVSLFWTPWDPTAQYAKYMNMAPSLSHLFGTDRFGRDILSRVMEGAGTTLKIASISVAIGATCGTIVGGLTGYFGGVADEILMRVNDAVTAFPSILLALVIISIIGPGSNNIIVVLGILFIPSFARVVRSEFAKQRHKDYVKNAKLMGVTDGRIIFVHILPNIATVLLSAIAIGFNNAVLAEASMSFLGVGVGPSERASLGVMLHDAQNTLLAAPWQALSAGLTISFMILGFALISEGLGFPITWRTTSKRRRKHHA